jgi:thiol-disulfide isomerase/thioredoxin
MGQSVLKRIPRLIFVTLLLLVMVVCSTRYSIAQEDLTPIPMISGIEMLKVGDSAPDFTVGDLSGSAFNMNTTIKSNKGVFIFFWSIFCEPCKAELPIIQKLSKTYKEKGIEFVGVSIDGSPMKEAISGKTGRLRFPCTYRRT